MSGHSFQCRKCLCLDVIVMFLIGSLCLAKGAWAEELTVSSSQNAAAIRSYLATVELSGKSYDLDHNRDVTVDLVVHLLHSSQPDLESGYVTLPNAMRQGQLVLRENPQLYGPAAAANPAVRGYQQRYGPAVMAMNYRPGRSQSLNPSGIFSQRGQLMPGGGQDRAMPNSGILGRGRRSRGNFPSRQGRRYGMYDQSSSSHGSNESEEFALRTWCFEKGRIIADSMDAGSDEAFTVSGMASPTLRRQLITTASQTKVHRLIDVELHRLGVQSRTAAYTAAYNDIFKDHNIAKTLGYYETRAKEVAAENPESVGLIVADRKGNILAADIYASPDLFRQMLPLLLQSAALEVHGNNDLSFQDTTPAPVAEFLSEIKDSTAWQKNTSQSYRYLTDTLVGEGLVLTDGNQETFVHLEIYPR